MEPAYRRDYRNFSRPDFHGYPTTEIQEMRQEMRLFQRTVLSRLDALDKEVKTNRVLQSLDSASRAHFVSDHIDSIMGLREALTTSNMFLRIVWAILVIIGLGATAYYLFRNTQEYLDKEVSTKSGLTKSLAYDVPPLIVCPPWPFDADAMESRGLDFDALMYSLGYSDLYSRYFDNKSEALKMAQVDPADPSYSRLFSARDRFHQYYNKSKFRTAVEYFKHISADIGTTSPEEPQNFTLAMKKTPDYSSILADSERNLDDEENKAIFSNGLCYKFRLKKASMRTTQDPAILTLTNYDHTRGIINPKKNAWFVDFYPSTMPRGPTISLQPFFKYTIKLSAQRIVMLKNASVCVDPESSPQYDQTKCAKDCVNAIYVSLGHQRAILLDDANINDMQNSFDMVAMVRMKQQEMIRSGRVNREEMNSDEIERVALNEALNYSAFQNALDPDDDQLQKCYETCRPTCDRIIYDVSISRDEALGEEEAVGKSAIAISVKHTAVLQGGIMTMQEIATVTFSDFVSNIGGTLGLFLGCTVMTFAQIFMAILSRLTRKR